MSGYSGTPLWKKLGYKAGTVALLAAPPENYLKLLALPSDIVIAWCSKPSMDVSLVHCFTKSKKELSSFVSSYRKRLNPTASVWISWPKKGSGMQSDLTENVIREVALPVGFVDIKVCAVDETWSGLKLVIRKELR